MNEENKEVKRTNSGKVIIILLVLVILSLSSYIAYDKITQKNDKTNKIVDTQADDKYNKTDKNLSTDTKKDDKQNSSLDTDTKKDNKQNSNSDTKTDSNAPKYIGNSTLTEEDVKKMIIVYFIQRGHELRVDDYKINKLSFEYNTDEHKKTFGYDSDSILFLIEYDVHPSNTESYNNYAAANGEIGSDGWIINKTGVGSIKKDKYGYYYVTSIGTGW